MPHVGKNVPEVLGEQLLRSQGPGDCDHSLWKTPDATGIAWA